MPLRHRLHHCLCYLCCRRLEEQGLRLAEETPSAAQKPKLVDVLSRLSAKRHPTSGTQLAAAPISMLSPSFSEREPSKRESPASASAKTAGACARVSEGGGTVNNGKRNGVSEVDKSGKSQEDEWAES